MSTDPESPTPAAAETDISAEWRDLQREAQARAASGGALSSNLCSSCWAELPSGAEECPDCGLAVAEMERLRQARQQADGEWSPTRREYNAVEQPAVAAAPEPPPAEPVKEWAPRRLSADDEALLAAAAAGSVSEPAAAESPAAGPAAVEDPPAAHRAAAEPAPTAARPRPVRRSRALDDMAGGARTLLILGASIGLLVLSVLAGAFVANITFPR